MLLLLLAVLMLCFNLVRPNYSTDPLSGILLILIQVIRHNYEILTFLSPHQFQLYQFITVLLTVYQTCISDMLYLIWERASPWCTVLFNVYLMQNFVLPLLKLEFSKFLQRSSLTPLCSVLVVHQKKNVLQLDLYQIC